MAMVGGTTSVITGGKFEDGAVSAAFVHLFNNEYQDPRLNVAYGMPEDHPGNKLQDMYNNNPVARGVHNGVTAGSASNTIVTFFFNTPQGRAAGIAFGVIGFGYGMLVQMFRDDKNGK